jgi:cell division protein FtsN
MLLAGIAIGSLGTMLWQGWRSGDGEVGSGIRRMMENSRQQAGAPDAAPAVPAIKPEPRQTNYDFFTVLPEIEVVVTEDEPPPPPPSKETPSRGDVSQGDENIGDGPVVSEVSPQPVSAYMLQAGSFNSESDAERQKAGLALLGLGSSIQKVTIQGRGDFYRVRLGPFHSHAGMVEADERLRREGIQALRLKVSRSGQGA